MIDDLKYVAFEASDDYIVLRYDEEGSAIKVF